MPWPFAIRLNQAERDVINAQIRHLYDIEDKVDQIMIMLKDVLDKVAMETTDIGSLTVLMQGLEDKITAIPGMTPEIQAQIDALFANVDANDKAIVAAMKIGVPPAPVPTVVPPVV
jgi:hypothetical protein